MDLSFLPAVNAGLNVVATSLLLVGRYWIRRGRVARHRRAMIGEFTVSSLSLVLYVAHKAPRGFENTPYHGEGLARLLYLAILFTHLTLAMAVPVLAIRLLQLGLAGRIERLEYAPRRPFGERFVLHPSVFFELFFTISHLCLTARLEDLLGLLVTKTAQMHETTI